MSTEMLAMLVASVVQGKVVAVYNRERQEVCHHLEQDAPASTTPWPQIASLQATVTAEKSPLVQQLKCLLSR